MRIRREVYRYAFTAPEHVKAFDSLEAGNVPDLFPVSDFGDAAKEPNFNPDSMRSVLKKWRDRIAARDAERRDAWKGGNSAAVEKIRNDLVEIMLEYPVHFEKVEEWIKVAAFYLDEAKKAPEKKAEIGEKFMLSEEEICRIQRNIQAIVLEKEKIQ